MLTTATEIPTAETSAPIDLQVWPIVSALVHDLRQPLSVIEACADYLNLVLPASDRRAHKHLEMLQRQVSDASRILRDALMKAHGEPLADARGSEPLVQSDDGA